MIRDRLYTLASRVGCWVLDRADRVPMYFANVTHEEDDDD